MSDTPETDAATLTEPYQVRELGFEVAHVDFSRNLERQRNDALQLARELRDALKPTLTALVGRMVIKDTDTVERAHAAITKANKLLK